MHSPNPMFPSSSVLMNSGFSPSSPTAWYLGYNPSLEGVSLDHKTQRGRQTIHRRAHSDFTGTPSRPDPSSSLGVHLATMTAPPDPASVEGLASGSQLNAHSRIPVSKRRYSHTSESGQSSPTSRANSSLGKQNANRPLPSKGSSALPKPKHKQTSPARRPRSAMRVTSPGTGDGRLSVQQAQKSPSLRANIIAPPPKISPPLRSSRPRLPVSTASTAASRAKMAEKFNPVPNQSRGTRYSNRHSQRPPELKNIDLEARRQRITQAFNKSLKEEERKEELAAERRRKALEKGRLDQKQKQEAQELDLANPMVQGMPAVVINGPETEDENEKIVYRTPAEEVIPEDHALKIDTRGATKVLSADAIDDADLPILGLPANRSGSENAQVKSQSPSGPLEAETDPLSAMTAETDSTNIENEPQAEFTMPKPSDRTILSQIMQMRSSSPVAPPVLNHSKSVEDTSELADQESIQIMLRSTQYFEDKPAMQEDGLDVVNDQPQLSADSQDRCSTSSWTSSIRDRSSLDGYLEPIVEASPDFHNVRAACQTSTSTPGSNHPNGWSPAPFAAQETARSTMASDAYTTVNIVLQQHLSSPVVNRDLVDDIYRKVLHRSPELTDRGGWDTERITQLCLEELAYHNDDGSWDMPTHLDVRKSESVKSKEDAGEEHDDHDNEPNMLYNQDEERHESDYDDEHVGYVSQIESKRDKYRASLMSADEFEYTSPSVGDWMDFGELGTPAGEVADVAPPLPPKDEVYQQDREGAGTPKAYERRIALQKEIAERGLGLAFRSPSRDAITQSQSLPLRPPSHSPPPRPSTALNSTERETARTSSPSIYASQPPSSVFSSTFPNHPPKRMVSLTRIASSRPETPISASAKSSAETGPAWDDRPSFEQSSLNTSSKRSSPSPEQRRLNKRRHVIKELIDTEASFGRDLKVIDDIYKGTSSSCLDLSTDDIKILFGNSEQIVQFSTSFLDTLKQAGKPVYVMPKSQRFQSRRGSRRGSHTTSASTSATAISDDQGSVHDSDRSDLDKDRQTLIGEAFKVHMEDMERVYTEYLRNHDAANKKLQALQQNPKVEIWLRECRQWASDLTSAWNLDSLLVKPVQRILKYPLLLTHLLDSTPDDHPDHNALKDALRELTEVSIRINEMKKHAELVEQVLSRKRKDSDVKSGLSKAFGRRTEKLKQHVGISELFEDKDYNSLKDRYSENLTQLFIVSRDVKEYQSSVVKETRRINEFAAAVDRWIDVHHSAFPELDSKWRQFAMAIRDVIAIGLPEHLAAIQKSVVDPMQSAAKMLETILKDPRGLLQKRDKKSIDFARFKNLKDRGEKLDKKTVERMEQWEALNREAKGRMSKLIDLTGSMVESCLLSFVQIQSTWLNIWRRKLSTTVGVIAADITQIERDWQQDYDYQEASALSLGICNGSLLADAVNMVSFLTPSTTLNGDDSPRQSSWNSSKNRSISLNSDGSPALLTEPTKRYSGSFTASPVVESHYDKPTPAQINGRMRTTSALSGRGVKTPEINTRSPSVPFHTTTPSNARPSNSAERSLTQSPPPPRLSIDAPSPSLSIGPITSSSPITRPASASTFFSASAAPGQPSPTPAEHTSTVFSSAMPMSDTPQHVASPVPQSPVPEDEMDVLFLVASVYEFNIDRARREAGFPYLTYVAGEIFDVVAEKGELWLARNQDDPTHQVGWIWNKHFARLPGAGPKG